MASLYDSERMADGYATARPPVHPQVIDIAHQRLGGDFDCALDVGCGSGLSTAPLSALARRVYGVEPSVPMLLRSARVAPRAHFAAACAEDLPFPGRCFDLLAAAGSLNYADLARFFPEARRVLRPRGGVLIYDFSQGSEFDDSPLLARWHDEFKRRYPSPPCPDIVPEQLPLAGHGFRLSWKEEFCIGIVMSEEAYLAYTLTETNVAAAPDDFALVRSWCADSLRPVFGGRSHEVLFRGYVAWAEKAE